MSECRIQRTFDKKGLWPVWKLALEVGGEPDASRLWVVEKTMRIGSAKVRFGGIAGVGTKETHRLKGYASQVLNASTDLMRERGFEMGMLFGIRDFYHRFGYGVVFPVSQLEVQTEALLRAKSPLKVRAMKQADGPSVRKAYNRWQARRTASVVRPGKWTGFELSQGFRKPGRTVLAEDARGRLQGYAVWVIRDGRFLVGEIGGTGAQAFETLARALGQRAKRAGIDRVIFDLPADDLFGDFCARYGCVRRVEYTRNAGAMGRIIHLKPLMTALAPELSRRAAQSGATCSLQIETDIGTVGLQARDGAVRVTEGGALHVKMPQLQLTQLVMGYRSADDVAPEPGVHVPKAAAAPLSALFPKTCGYMWWSDRF